MEKDYRNKNNNYRLLGPERNRTTPVELHMGERQTGFSELNESLLSGFVESLASDLYNAKFCI